MAGDCTQEVIGWVECSFIVTISTASEDGTVCDGWTEIAGYKSRKVDGLVQCLNEKR